jgi:[NiFe] hydrogenase assembly HybE family chaperone
MPALTCARGEATRVAMSLRPHERDPGAALEAAFRRVQRERMADMPLLNPALRVEAVDFARWQGQWLGALVSPWFVNLILVPGDAATWVSVPEGKRRFLNFPAGDFAFLGGYEPEVGEFQCCSLISPPAQFAAHEDARATAREALRLLHLAPTGAAPCGAAVGTERAMAAPHAPCAEGVGGAGLADPFAPRPAATKPARRVFLFGRAA